jgi:hypothetical protein
MRHTDFINVEKAARDAFAPEREPFEAQPMTVRTIVIALVATAVIAAVLAIALWRATGWPPYG